MPGYTNQAVSWGGVSPAEYRTKMGFPFSPIKCPHPLITAVLPYKNIQYKYINDYIFSNKKGG